MFGFGVPKLPDDPVKMALLTTGLSMLASGDPQQTIKALPQVMGAALRAREDRKDRKAQMEFEKQKFELQKQAADLKMQEYKRQQALRENMMRMLGIGGSPQPAAPNLAQPTQPAPGAISGPVRLPGAPLPQPVQKAQATPQLPAQTPPVAVPGSVAGVKPSTLTQDQQVAVDNAKKNPAVMGAVRSALMKLDHATRAYIANNPRLFDNIVLKTAMSAAGLSGGPSEGKPQFLTFRTRDGKEYTIDVGTREGRSRANMLVNYYDAKVINKGGESKDIEVLKAERAKDFANDLRELNKMKRAVRTMEWAVHTLAKSPQTSTGPGAGVINRLKQTAESLFGVKIPGTSEAEVIDMFMKKVIMDRAGSLAQGISENDRNFLVSMYPNLSTTPGGFVAAYVMFNKVMKSELERANFIRSKLKQGYSIIDAENEWDRYRRENPLFSDKKTFAQEVRDYMDKIGWKKEGRSLWEQLSLGEKTFDEVSKKYGGKSKRNAGENNYEKEFSEFKMKHPDIAKNMTLDQYRRAREAGAIVPSVK